MREFDTIDKRHQQAQRAVSKISCQVSSKRPLLQYVVVPTRRATGQAINLICAHAIGEAGSPYLVGLITDAFHNHYQGANSTCE